jgi:hypothetical protein
MLIDRDVQGAEESVELPGASSAHVLTRSLQIHQTNHRGLATEQDRHVSARHHQGARQSR